MKKVLKSSVIVTMLMLVVIAAASCGSGKQFSTIDDYAKSESVQSQIESIKDSFSDTLNVNVYGEGNTLVYEYKYINQIDDSVLSATKSALDKAIESQKSTFVDVAKVIPTLVDVSENDVEVAVRYINADGTLITESVFKAND